MVCFMQKFCWKAFGHSLALWLLWFGEGGSMVRAESPVAAMGSTVLGTEGSHFTLNGKPTFLLGLSYYGGLGASLVNLQQDLDEAKRDGFNWIRVWATWNSSTNDLSAVD